MALTFSHGKTETDLQPGVRDQGSELCNHRGNLQSVAAELDVSAKNLSRWKQEYESGKLGGTSRPAVPKSSGEIENMALSKALREAELEQGILKSRSPSSPRATGKVRVHQGLLIPKKWHRLRLFLQTTLPQPIRPK